MVASLGTCGPLYISMIISSVSEDCISFPVQRELKYSLWAVGPELVIGEKSYLCLLYKHVKIKVHKIPDPTKKIKSLTITVAEILAFKFEEMQIS